MINFKITLAGCLIFLLGINAIAQTTDSYGLTKIGEIKPRNANEIEGSNWLLGCETLDRDYTDYDAYKEYLNPLGIKRLRLQGGWAKTEKIKGQYDWAWLDHIVNDATARGLEPWIQFSYGNEIYEGGGGINLAAGVPHSEVALAAWDRWVAAMVSRYKDKVINWEIWNEPNFGDNLENTAEKAAALNIRTIEIVKRIQPEAKVSGMAFGHIDLEYAAKFLGCHAIRVNSYTAVPYSTSKKAEQEAINVCSSGLRQLCEFADDFNIDVIIENHGGFSSNGKWLAEMIRQTAHKRAGTLPDFGNFVMNREGGKIFSYDSYRGVDELMPSAKGVSLKPMVWNDQGNETQLDYTRMMKIVLGHGFKGYVGIEHGTEGREWESIKEIRSNLEIVRRTLANEKKG